MFKKDVQYVVRGTEIMIVDEFTGRVLEGRRWSNGLHQSVCAWLMWMSTHVDAMNKHALHKAPACTHTASESPHMHTRLRTLPAAANGKKVLLRAEALDARERDVVT